MRFGKVPPMLEWVSSPWIGGNPSRRGLREQVMGLMKLADPRPAV
jgi:hypothetical protein